ncbi:hypothetical protein ESB00_18525 [Oleiharenicola lentus]|uniref:Type II toxin-antitoxin system RelE/ParE family toxin n=1 Tax=Oleiharenicola lentus TaxID=2508720 RepID=A0A4Q1C5R6_9BACT|nr:hypothetical protein [Oleiharenicola lentus]RXK53683.1 hypothetical protein ESB00_18525 [Oleiharenicola lentus]
MDKVSRYRPVFADSAVAFFVSLSRRRQIRLLDRARELAADPFLVPDLTSTDADGRIISHLLTDGFVFDYWVDHAARVLAITDITDAD